MLSFGLIAAQIFRRWLNVFVLKLKTCKLILGEGRREEAVFFSTNSARTTEVCLLIKNYCSH